MSTSFSASYPGTGFRVGEGRDPIPRPGEILIRRLAVAALDGTVGVLAMGGGERGDSSPGPMPSTWDIDTP
jgi:hypothetical protein